MFTAIVSYFAFNFILTGGAISIEIDQFDSLPGTEKGIGLIIGLLFGIPLIIGTLFYIAYEGIFWDNLPVSEYYFTLNDLRKFRPNKDYKLNDLVMVIVSGYNVTGPGSIGKITKIECQSGTKWYEVHFKREDLTSEYKESEYYVYSFQSDELKLIKPASKTHLPDFL